MNPQQTGELVSAGLFFFVGLGLLVVAMKKAVLQKRSMLVGGCGIILFSAVRMLQIGIAGSGAGSAQTSVPFSSADGRYTAVFPRLPDTNVADQHIDGVNVRMNNTRTTTDGGKWYFSTMFKEYPKGSLAGASLDGVKETFSAMYRTAPTRDTKLTVSGIEAREFVFPVDDRLAMRCRVFVVDDRLYNVMVVAPSGEINSSRSTGFFESFHLVRDGRGR